MIRPLTCLTLLAAGGAGLYLYQEKHRVQLLEREINRTVHATEQTREHTTMLRAEWALLNEPERLAALALQHLSLQPVAPSQFAQLADLGNRLPPVGAPTLPPAPVEEPVPLPAPVAALAAPRAAPPVKPAPLVAQGLTTSGTLLPARPAVPLMVQATQPVAQMAQAVPAASVPAASPARLARPVRVATADPAPRMPDPAPRAPAPLSRLYAPVLPAFASQAPAQAIHAPSVQQAAALQQAPYVGSALGMSRTGLAPPVPIADSPGR